jgi:hypothetical protein
MQRLLHAVFAASLSVALAAVGQGATPPPAPQPSKAQKPQKPAREAAAAQPSTGTAAIAGTLVTADTGKPIRRAAVRLVSRDPRIVRSAVTDLQGKFAFGDLPAGAFTLSASQPGYLDVTYGQKKPGAGGLGTPIRIADRQHLNDITLRMPRGGVLTGTVLDEYGDAAFGIQVRAFRFVMRTGERALEPAGAARTDDRGIYRIPALPPGDYIVSATPREIVVAAADPPNARAGNPAAGAAADPAATARKQAAAAARSARAPVPPPPDPAAPPPDGYAPVFYPGATAASGATTVALDVSEERAGIDLQLQLVPMARVEGSVAAPGGTLPPGARVELIDRDGTQPGKFVRTAAVTTDGRFSFSALAPGRYALMARGVVPGAGAATLPARAQPRAGAPAAVKKAARAGVEIQTLWAMSEIAVDGHNLLNVTLSLQPGMTVAGRVAYEGTTPPADRARLRVALEPAGQLAAGGLASAAPAPVTADGMFVIAGVVPGSYHVRLTGLAGATGWALASAMAAGRDVLDSALEVRPGEDLRDVVLTLTDRQTDLSGTLQSPSGQPTDDYYVIVFSTDHTYWTPESRHIQATRPGTDGRYAFRGLPPGDYRVTALVDVEPGGWFDPALLRQLTGASVAISLGAGEKKVQDLRVGR